MAKSSKTKSSGNPGGGFSGTISRRSIIDVDLSNGIFVSAPVEYVFKAGAPDTIGGIVDIVCKFVDCGGGG